MALLALQYSRECVLDQLPVYVVANTHSIVEGNSI